MKRVQVMPIYKPLGATPLETIQLVRAEYPQYKDETISYAGRLDPMAEGVLLLLIGDENKKRQEYEHLPKSYDFSVLFGIATDSYDVLGKIVKTATPPSLSSLQKMLLPILPSFLGERKQPYPPFSAKPVSGKPLFAWAREGKIDTVQIPEKTVSIFEIKITGYETVTAPNLHKEITTRIAKVNGTFRQDEILRIWGEYLERTATRSFPLVHCSIDCSSGTYVRSIANELGQTMDIPSLAFRILRTRVGTFTEKQAYRLGPASETQ